jgi:hypothetical protein
VRVWRPCCRTWRRCGWFGVFCKGAGVRIKATTTATEVSCPECGFVARRVHSRYVHRLADWV